MEPKWLDWARRLQAIAQNGLTYATNHFDVDHYRAVHKVAAEMMASNSETDWSQIQQLLDGESGYATPKIDVRGVVFRNKELLLVRELEDNRWTLPGGWADVGESPGEAVTREVFEESGYQTRAVKLLAVYDRARHAHVPHPFHIYKLFFLCEIVGGSAADSVETKDAAFFEEGNIPELSVSRTTAAQISRLFEHHRHPEWQTDFD
jgi:ADP-ribose pyrophosphatase YjhB (NUDIX family)